MFQDPLPNPCLNVSHRDTKAHLLETKKTMDKINPKRKSMHGKQEKIKLPAWIFQVRRQWVLPGSYALTLFKKTYPNVPVYSTYVNSTTGKVYVSMWGEKLWKWEDHGSWNGHLGKLMQHIKTNASYTTRVKTGGKGYEYTVICSWHQNVQYCDFVRRVNST